MAEPIPGATALTHLLVVRDTHAARTFYEDVLGAEVFREYDGSVVLKLLDNWLLLVTTGGPTPDKPHVHMVPPTDPDHVSAELIFRVDDCHTAHAALVERGAQFLTPPVDRGLETRAFFRDLQARGLTGTAADKEGAAEAHRMDSWLRIPLGSPASCSFALPAPG
jgi:extradiol dioxygenase family protein